MFQLSETIKVISLKKREPYRTKFAEVRQAILKT